jgi:hypothetical protein
LFNAARLMSTKLFVGGEFLLFCALWFMYTSKPSNHYFCFMFILRCHLVRSFLGYQWPVLERSIWQLRRGYWRSVYTFKCSCVPVNLAVDA